VARGWLDLRTHGVLLAVSRLTPGTNILAYCVALGWRAQGWRGSAVALVAASIPGALLIFALTALVARLDRFAAVRALLAAGMAVAAALVLSSAWHLLRPHLEGRQRRRVIAIVGIAGVLAWLDVTPVRVLLAAAAAGALLPGGLDTE
jgi:chromate transporter